MTPLTLEAPVLARLSSLAIAHEVYRHPPLHTVAESQRQRGVIPGLHLKNLLVRDKKRTLFLVVVPEHCSVDMKALRYAVGARGAVSFASAELLWETLGVRPGSVTALGVMNDADQRVTLVLDEAVRTAPLVCCHPLHNEATVVLAASDVVAFAEACGHPPRVVAVPRREPSA